MLATPSTNSRHAAQLSRPASYADLEQHVCRLPSIGLPEMDSAALQDRVDTKYVLPASELQPILDALADCCRILEIDGLRLHRYRTLYFDTGDWALYRSHHAGSRNRYKVRSRWYASTGQAFVETKRKTNTGRTIKHRMPTSAFAMGLTTGMRAFVYAHLPAGTQQLEPVLTNEFRRVTLVSAQNERLTIDVQLRFGHGVQALELPGIAVVELKQAHRSSTSDLASVLRVCHARPTRFSKYCIGASLLYPELKHNNFKPIHRLLDRLMQGDAHDFN